jgi:hypothetical protein
MSIWASIPKVIIHPLAAVVDAAKHLAVDSVSASTKAELIILAGKSKGEMALR